MAARARAAAQQLGAEIKTSAAVDAAGQQPAIGLRHRLPGIELTLDEGMLATGVTQQTIDLVNGIDPPFTAIDADPLTGSKRGTQQRRAMHGEIGRAACRENVCQYV